MALLNRKVRTEYASATPNITQTTQIDNKSIIELEALIEMKLNSFRRKDQTRLLDMC